MLLMHDYFFSVAKKTTSTLHTLLKKFRVDGILGENIKSVTSTVMSLSLAGFGSPRSEMTPRLLVQHPQALTNFKLTGIQRLLHVLKN
jgi:hypothetical protein